MVYILLSTYVNVMGHLVSTATLGAKIGDLKAVKLTGRYRYQLKKPRRMIGATCPREDLSDAEDRRKNVA